MRIESASRSTAARRRVSLWRYIAWRQLSSYPLSVLAIAFAALALAGCGGDITGHAHASRGSSDRIPLPKSALMKRPSAPKCEYRTASLDRSDGRLSDASPPSSEGKLDAALRRKLDYERECYRLSELIVRSQLTRLQAAIRDTMKSIKQREEIVATP